MEAPCLAGMLRRRASSKILYRSDRIPLYETVLDINVLLKTILGIHFEPFTGG